MFRESNSTSSILAFLAFIIAGIDAILGVLSLKSQVMTPGALKLIVCRPESTSLVTSIPPSLTSILEAKVA